MSFVLIALVALVVSGLTLLTGFGLGTLLLPVFALVFSVPVAVAATAIVHLANNFFKLALLRGDVRGRVVLRFGLPAVVAAFAGAWLLGSLAGLEPLGTWRIRALGGTITPLKLVMGTLILIFALFDVVPRLREVRIGERYLPLGGLFSGFFGGLSGHQGALRAAFLGRLSLTPSSFAATQAALACLVDLARTFVYGTEFLSGRLVPVRTHDEWILIAVAVVSAFAGSLLGKRLLPRVTVKRLRLLSGSLLVLVGTALASGVV